MAVRRERVILDLQTNIPQEALKSAAALRLLNEEVNRLSRRSGGSSVRGVDKDLQNVGKEADKAGREIDKYSGRFSALADMALTLGPALVPIGAVGIPAVAGLASQFGFAAIGAGTAIGAFQGVGDALKAMNTAHLEPTTANLQAAQQAMDEISPSAQAFVKQLQSMVPELKALRDTAAANMFPGLTEGLQSMETVLPKVQRIVGAVSGELGQIGADAGASLASPRWASFFTFLEQEAPKALGDMAAATGNVAHAAAQMWMAFTPLNHDFSGWMVKATADLDRWATGLSKTQGFADFIAYVQKSGPQVGAAMSAIGNALLQIVEAAAPIGGPVLQALTGLANVVAKIADSDLGTPIMAGVIAMRLYSRATQGVGAFTETAYGSRAKSSVSKFGNALLDVTTAQERASRSVRQANQIHRERMGTLAKGVGTMALFATAASGAADKIGLSNTASLALAGTMAGPLGFAAGAAAGAFLDLRSAGQGVADVIDHINAHSASTGLDQLARDAAAAKKQLYDVTHTSSVGDFLGDAGTTLGAMLHGKSGGDLASAAQKSINDLSTGQATARLTLLKQGFDLTAAGARQAGQSTAEFTRDVQKMSNVLSGRAGLRDYQAAIDDFTTSLLQNGHTLDVHTAKGRANQAALDNIANTALRLAPTLSAVDRVPFMARARRQFIAAAQAAGMGEKAARRLANSVLGLNNVKGTAKVLVGGVPQAMSQVRAFRALVLDATRPRTASITVQRHVVGGIGPLLTPADGTTVPGPRYPYYDRVPALLAPGEEVISNRYGQADRHRDLLKAINENRLANGGTARHRHHGQHATHHSGVPAHVSVELERLRKAVASSTKAIDDETKARDDLVSKRDDLKSGVTTSLTHDLWNQPANLSWMSAGDQKKALTGEVFSTLRADTAAATQYNGLLHTLAAKGLKGDALGALAGTGDVARVSAFAGLSKKDVGTYQTLFNQRAAATSATGTYASYAAFGAQNAQMNRNIATLVAQGKELNRRLTAAEHQPRTIHVHAAHNPTATAKEVSRRQAQAARH